jgi:hypothetical protein
MPSNILSYSCSKPKTLSKNNLIPLILGVIFPMCAEPDQEDLDDENDLTAHKVRFIFTIVTISLLHNLWT